MRQHGYARRGGELPVPGAGPRQGRERPGCRWSSGPGRTLASAVLLALGLGASGWALAAEPAPAPAAPTAAVPALATPTALDKVVTKAVASLMERSHYSHLRLDDAMSARLFDEYFDRLDYNRSFFLASDIQQFETYRNVLDDQLLQGSVDFAFDVYALFLHRVRDRVAFTAKLLDPPMDFTVDEAMVVDRSSLPWCADPAALDEVWRQRIKNSLLTYQLMDESLAKAPHGTLADPVDPDDEEAPAAPPPANGKQPADAAPRKTPKERVLGFHERYLRQLEENDSIEVVELYLNSLTRLYDPHSSYMAPSTEQDFDIAMKLSLQGIGALLTVEDSYVKVVELIPGGPAELDGRLKEGDRIVAVAQEKQEPVDVIDMPLRRVVKMIRGQKGTKVLLTVVQVDKGLGSVPVVIDLVRDEVKLTEQEARSEFLPLRPAGAPPAAPGGASDQAQALVIYLPSFYSDFEGRHKGADDYKSSTRDVQRLIEQAKSGVFQGLILDLRSDGGGSLDEAITVAGLFVPSGPVVQIRQADGSTKKRYDDDGKCAYDGPLVVLTNRLSASASEIVAAAIQDHGRGVIVGEAATHGKGTVQTVYHLDRLMRASPLFRGQQPGSLKFTMAKFYRVTGGSTQKKGVTPDVTLASFTDHMELGEAFLPNALPWDEIEPLPIERTVDVGPLLSELKRRSSLRLAADSEYQALLRDIAAFGERRQEKTLTLNREKRLQRQDEEEQWSKKVRRLTARKRSDVKGKPGREDQAPAEDSQLDEALRVLADLVELQGSGARATGVVGAVSDTPQPGTPPAAAAGAGGAN